MRSSGVATVVESKHESFAEAGRVAGLIGWTGYAASDGARLNKLRPDVSPEAALCVLALAGLTAYQGRFRFSHQLQVGRSGEIRISAVRCPYYAGQFLL